MKRFCRFAFFALLALPCGAAPTTYYVATNGLDTGVYDGLSWAAPFKTISNAVVRTVNTDVVLVSNGVYTLGATIVVTNAITLRGINGSGATVINGNNGVRCMVVSNASAVVDGFSIIRGSFSGSPGGAGVCCYSGSVVSCVITGNTHHTSGGDSAGGGGVWLTSGLVSNCTIAGNTSLYSGGGIRLGGTNAIVSHCRILNNYADVRASGVVAAGGGTFRNCLIAGNWSVGVGAVLLGGSSLMQNCTVVGNISPTNNAVNAGSTAVIANSIIRDNTYLLAPGPTNFGASTPTITYSCLEFPYTGVGNMATNPVFWDPAATNYALSTGSPCIDAGTNGSWTAGTDLAGNPRIANSQCDIGAYEYTVGALTCAVTALPAQGLAPLDVSLSAKAYGLNTNNLYYRWSYTNSATINEEGTDKQSISHTYPAGLFMVTLTVSNQAGDVARDDQLLKVSAPTCHVSKAGTHVYPFVDWTTAATTIQAAVDAAVAGATVLLTNGVYTNSSAELTLSEGIKLTSVNGTGVTFIVGSTGVRCLFMNHPSAVVERVTLRNGGNTGQGGCVYIRYGTVQDSIIRSASLTGGGSTGGGGGAYMLMGTLSNCLVMANKNNNTAAGTGIRVAGNSLVTHCIIKDNSNTSSGQGVGIFLDAGTIRNSLICSNTSATSSAGVGMAAGARMENCTVAGNSGQGGITGAFYVANGAIIVNSIVRDNFYSVSTPTNFGVYTNPVISYSNLEFPWPGESNLCTNAAFMDPAVFNYTLQGSSPCVDAGTNLSWMVAGSKDLAGNPRVGNNRADMGAYELTLGDLTCSIVASPTRGLSPLPVSLEASVIGSNTNGLYYRWSFTNSMVIDSEGADKKVVTYDYAPGSPTATLVVSNEAGQVAQDTQDFKISAPTCHVARTGFNIPSFPYDSWATAASNIHDAVNAAVGGAVVLVTNGTYAVTQQLALAEAITVCSVNGAAVTTIDAGGSPIRRCFYLTDTGAVVRGLTLYRGSHAEQGGGVYMSYGTVADCAISNCTIAGGGTTGGGGGVYVVNGMVSNCVISGNSVASHGGGVRLAGANGLVTDCTIRSNQTTSVANNYGQGGGVVVEAGTLRNCLIVGNTASNNGGGLSIGPGTMQSCSVVGNQSAGTEGGGVRVLGSSVVIVNSIVRDNVYREGTPTNFGTGLPTVSFSCLEFPWAGTQNIATDPFFLNAAAGDYRPGWYSPCRNAGTNQDWMAQAKDLAGAARIQFRVVDMGAYEALPLPGAIFMIQ